MATINIKLSRIFSLIVKEFLTIFRDPKAGVLLIIPPFIQLFIFAFAATLEVKNISIAVLNKDYGKHGYEVIQRINGSPIFTSISFLKNDYQVKPTIDQQKSIAVLVIPEDFSKKIEKKQISQLQIILDGRRSNSAQIVNNYLENLILTYSLAQGLKMGGAPPPAHLVFRNWYNENLLYIWVTVPSLLGILTMLVVLLITALSVAREREIGTFEQLIISPLSADEILIGKTVPAVVIGLFEGLVIAMLAVFVFHIPFRGSLLLLLFALLLFILSIVGIGLFISSQSKTQQQALLFTFIFMVPAISLSGYATPVENMPIWLQKIVPINPLIHFLIIIKGLFLKDMTFQDILSHIWPLMIIGVVTFTIARWSFNKKVY